MTWFYFGVGALVSAIVAAAVTIGMLLICLRLAADHDDNPGGNVPPTR